ncbi:unnamed protein product [Brachionus calyciflorus]|uniref:Transmembrane protein 45B n=1 Tax=Brachionus calyciflorus TaxID=104777 RepID=A0A813M436_9BILA|nr:unnamed protein product [Brachionus calyciflorus]
MGSLGGHLLPGSFFIIFAIWWGFVTAVRFVQSRSNRKRPFKSSVTMPCIFLPCATLRTAPVESYLKAILALIALVIEILTSYSISYLTIDELNRLNNMANMESSGGEHGHKRAVETAQKLYKHYSFALGNFQHVTMYSAFIIGAIVEILVHHKFDLPKRIEYAMGVLAFSVEAFLFAFHLHGKEVVDVYVHLFLVYAIFGCIICAGLECYNPHNVLFVYGRILFTLLQGTWFFQVGFMLYPPTDNPAYHWNLKDHGNIMIVTICYCWHVMLIVIGLIGQLWFVKKVMGGARYSILKCIDDDCLRTERNEMKFLTLDSSDSEDNSFEETVQKHQKTKSSDSKFAITDDNNV